MAAKLGQSITALQPSCPAPSNRKSSFSAHRTATVSGHPGRFGIEPHLVAIDIVRSLLGVEWAGFGALKWPQNWSAGLMGFAPLPVRPLRLGRVRVLGRGPKLAEPFLPIARTLTLLTTARDEPKLPPRRFPMNASWLDKHKRFARMENESSRPWSVCTPLKFIWTQTMSSIDLQSPTNSKGLPNNSNSEDLPHDAPQQQLRSSAPQQQLKRSAPQQQLRSSASRGPCEDCILQLLRFVVLTC
jgi:hypothetical protein